MNNKTLLFITLLLSLLLSQGCTGKTIDQFPDADIVYQANEREQGILGFINGDGSNNVLIEVDFFANLPSWSSDGSILFFSQIPGDQAYIPTRIGDLSTVRQGKTITRCRKGTVVGSDIHPYLDTFQVVISNGFEINLIDAIKCRKIKTFIDYKDTNLAIASMSISRDGSILLFSEHSYNTADFKGKEFAIKKMDLVTGNVETIGQGASPILSPDNRKVAYVWYDGFYLMDSDGSNTKRTIKYLAGEKTGSWISFFSLPPSPHWSPDGEWLVYHKCNKAVTRSCSPPSEFGIYKFNVLDGKEYKLVDGGLYPYWK